MITAIVTILIFLIMISLHEFGHFITAKACGIRVLEYAIGMGPAIWKKQKGETLYSIRILPVGGYCKFEGEDETSDDPRAFCSQKLWKRFIVVSAGAVFNIILGFAVFVIVVAMVGVNMTNRIDSVVPQSYLAMTDVQSGDKIVGINGKRVRFYYDISLYTQDLSSEETELKIKKADGSKTNLTVKPSLRETIYEYTEDGIEVTVNINGEKSDSAFYEYGDDTLEKDPEKIGTSETVQSRYIIGFVPCSEDVTFVNVWGQAYNMTIYVVKLVYQSLFDMIRGAVSVNELSGPVGIVSVVHEAVSAKSDNLLQVLNLMGLLTINLGVFNLLPIPALDGGRLLFMIIELIRRKPVPPEKEGMIHAIGLLLLLALIIFVSFNDVMKLIS